MRKKQQAAPEQDVRAKVINRFDDPKSALEKERHELTTYTGIDSMEEYYVPPLPFDVLIKLMRTNPHHGPLPSFKAQQVIKDMLPNKLISRQTVRRVMIEYEATGNGFFLSRRNNARQAAQLDYLPVINTRRLTSKQERYGLLRNEPDPIVKYGEGEVLHIKQHDPFQEIYGVPYWLGALQSILLGEGARVYMRLFFENGGSNGDILATSGLSGPAQEVVETVMDGPTGDGRFKRMLLQFPRGKIDEMFKVLPYSTGSEKIDMTKLVAGTATDILEGWRIRPEVVGMRPENVGGSGDLDKIRQMFYETEIVPLQQMLSDELADFLGPKHPLEFRDPYAGVRDDSTDDNDGFETFATNYHRMKLLDK